MYVNNIPIFILPKTQKYLSKLINMYGMCKCVYRYAPTPRSSAILFQISRSLVHPGEVDPVDWNIKK